MGLEGSNPRAQSCQHLQTFLGVKCWKLFLVPNFVRRAPPAQTIIFRAARPQNESAPKSSYHPFHFFANPTSYRSFWSPSGLKCPGECARECPRKRGCPRECPMGSLRGPSGPGHQKKCPETVPRVSERCPGHSGDTLGTLFGDSGARGPKGPGETLCDTPSDTPVFRTLSGTLPGTLRARRVPETPVAGRGVRNHWDSLNRGSQMGAQGHSLQFAHNRP